MTSSSTVECQCPACGAMARLPLETLDLQERTRCEACGAPLFSDGFQEETASDP